MMETRFLIAASIISILGALKHQLRPGCNTGRDELLVVVDMFQKDVFSFDRRLGGSSRTIQHLRRIDVHALEFH